MIKFNEYKNDAMKRKMLDYTKIAHSTQLL